MSDDNDPKGLFLHYTPDELAAMPHPEPGTRNQLTYPQQSDADLVRRPLPEPLRVMSESWDGTASGNYTGAPFPRADLDAVLEYLVPFPTIYDGRDYVPPHIAAALRLRAWLDRAPNA